MSSVGTWSGFESPDLDRPGRLPHQQGLCEARLGYRDGSPQLGAPGPGLVRANQCALSQGYRGAGEGVGGLISTVAAGQTEPGSTNLASTVSVHMRLFGFFFCTHTRAQYCRALSLPLPHFPPPFPPPSHPPAIPPSHPAMPAAAACKCILHARRRSQRLPRPPAASSSLATSPLRGRAVPCAARCGAAAMRSSFRLFNPPNGLFPMF